MPANASVSLACRDGKIYSIYGFENCPLFFSKIFTPIVIKKKTLRIYVGTDLYVLLIIRYLRLKEIAFDDRINSN